MSNTETVEVVIQPTEEEMKSTAGFCTIASLVPFPINEEKPGLYPSRFTIPKSDCKIPKVLHIGKATHFVYLDESRGSLQIRNSADEVANAIVNDYLSAQLGITEDAYPALFWVPGKVSAAQILGQYKDKIERLKEIQRNWFTIISRIADDDWTRYQKHSSVGDFQRVAAKELGWLQKDHPWMGYDHAAAEAARAQICPACMTPVPNGAIVCAACSCILDPKRHKELTFTSK